MSGPRRRANCPPFWPPRRDKSTTYGWNEARLPLPDGEDDPNAQDDRPGQSAHQRGSLMSAFCPQTKWTTPAPRRRRPADAAAASSGRAGASTRWWTSTRAAAGSRTRSCPTKMNGRLVRSSQIVGNSTGRDRVTELIERQIDDEVRERVDERPDAEHATDDLDAIDRRVAGSASPSA